MLLEVEVVTSDRFQAWTFPLICTTEDGKVFDEILMNREDKVGTESTTQLYPVPLTKFLSFEFSLVKEVETVLAARYNNLLYLWVVTDKFDRAIREKIYAREREIIDEFKELEFDFNIVSRRGRSLRELISDPMLTLAYQRDPQGLRSRAD